MGYHGSAKQNRQQPNPTRDASMTDQAYDPQTGRPTDKTYLEMGLPDNLDEALRAMKASWAVVDTEGYDINWADAHSEFIARINSCEVESEITHEQADYLRANYV